MAVGGQTGVGVAAVAVDVEEHLGLLQVGRVAEGVCGGLAQAAHELEHRHLGHVGTLPLGAPHSPLHDVPARPRTLPLAGACVIEALIVCLQSSILVR